MSVARDIAVDPNIEPGQKDLAPIDSSYTNYSYDRVPISSGNPKNWTSANQIVRFMVPTYDDSVYDLDESYLELKARVHVVFNDGDGDVSNPLHGYSSCAVEKYFMSSLLANLEVTYGGVALNLMDSSPDLFPHLHAVYTTLTNKSTKVIGSARCTNFRRTAATDINDILTNTRNAYAARRNWEVHNDVEWPYNECQYPSVHDEVTARADATNLPFPVQANNATLAYAYYPAFLEDDGHQYRSSLVVNPNSAISPVVNGPTNSLLPDYQLHILMKMKHPFFNTGKKVPANLPLVVSLKKSAGIQWSFMGDAVHDATLSGGIDYTGAGRVSSKYELNVDDLNLYMKRLTMSQNQLASLSEARNLIYDVRQWHAQPIDLTSTNMNINVSFAGEPQLLLVGLLPTSSINVDTTGTAFERFTSLFDTVPRQQLSFRNLYINSNRGRIPETPYESALDVNSAGSAQEMRAWHEFRKAMVRQDDCPISFAAWREVFNWYAFLINDNGENVNGQAIRKGKSNLHLVFDLVGSGTNNLSAYKLVVIDVQQQELVIQDFKQVTKIE